MWAQLITMRLKAGKQDELPRLVGMLEALEQADSGMLRSTAFVDQHDPQRAYFLVVFQSEAHARAREGDPRRAEGLEAVRGVMGEAFEGPPEFVDLTVVAETSP